MKHIIHVNQHIIRRNVKQGLDDPAITVKTYRNNQYARKISIFDRAGNLVVTIVQNMEKPLSCGARVWIEVAEEAELFAEQLVERY